jgi:hypothetical protein
MRRWAFLLVLFMLLDVFVAPVGIADVRPKSRISSTSNAKNTRQLIESIASPPGSPGYCYKHFGSGTAGYFSCTAKWRSARGR